MRNDSVYHARLLISVVSMLALSGCMPISYTRDEETGTHTETTEMPEFSVRSDQTLFGVALNNESEQNGLVFYGCTDEQALIDLLNELEAEPWKSLTGHPVYPDPTVSALVLYFGNNGNTFDIILSDGVMYTRSSDLSIMYRYRIKSEIPWNDLKGLLVPDTAGYIADPYRDMPELYLQHNGEAFGPLPKEHIGGSCISYSAFSFFPYQPEPLVLSEGYDAVQLVFSTEPLVYEVIITGEDDVVTTPFPGMMEHTDQTVIAGEEIRDGILPISSRNAVYRINVRYNAEDLGIQQIMDFTDNPFVPYVEEQDGNPSCWFSYCFAVHSS